LPDQARSNPVQCLQIKLIVSLHWNAACRRSLNSLRDRVGVSEVVLVTLPERFGISWRYLLYVMAERTELASHIVRRHPSFDSDQAPRHIGESGCDPAAGNLLPQNDRALVVEAD
jgi:hypothetical protein